MGVGLAIGSPFCVMRGGCLLKVSRASVCQPAAGWPGPRARREPRDSEREREPLRERESFIRNNLHNGVVSGAARGQALLGPMWAGLTPDSKGDPTGDTEVVEEQ